MSDAEQGVLAEVIETGLAPLTQAREVLDATLLEDAECGREQTRLKAERERLRSLWRGAQAAEQGSTVRALEALRQQPNRRPFARMELQADLERYVSKLATLVGEGEAQALAADSQRTPSWRLQGSSL